MRSRVSKSKKERILSIRKKLILNELRTLTDPFEYMQFMCEQKHLSPDGTMMELLDQFVRHPAPKLTERQKRTLSFDYGVYYGQVYQIDKVTSMPHGIGRMKFKNGNTYEGRFSFGVIDGEGLLYAKDKTVVMKGIWEQGNLSGHVTIYENNKLTYDGSYENNLRSGYGLYRQHRTEYRGYFFNDEYHGYGVLKSRDGTYSGHFRNGKKHGTGTCSKFTGKYDKYGIRIYQIQKGLWENDSFVCDVNWKKKELSIQGFLDSGRIAYLKEISSTDLKKVINLRNSFNSLQDRIHNSPIHVKSKKMKKCDWIEILLKEQKKMKQETRCLMSEYDLFGNKIITPVRGSDNEIYDLCSMEFLFEKNEKGEYLNIVYGYEKDNRVPLFPIMGNGKILDSYKKL